MQSVLPAQLKVKAMDNQHNDTSRSRVLIWDIPVRLFHWTQLALFVSLFVTAEVLDDKIELHAKLGLVLLALVLFRLLWGFMGSSYARFMQFLKGPRSVFAYIPSLLSRQNHFEAGHNPLGGWMVLALLLLVLAQIVVGLFANDDILFDGPLAYLVSKETSDLLTGLHEDLFHLLLILVGLHVAAVIWHKLVKGDNLLATMITGYKPLPLNTQAEDARGGGLVRAVVLLGVCATLVYTLLI